MITYNEHFYIISDVVIEDNISTIYFYTKKYSTVFNATNNIDQVSILYYIYKGQDYFITDPNINEQELNTLLENKLSTELINGNEQRGIDAGWYLNDKEYKLSTKRTEIAKDIDKKTNYIIANEYRYSIQPDVPVHSTLEWQFDVQNLFLNRDFLTYPYELKTSVDNNARNLYVTFSGSSDLYLMYMEMFSHIDTSLSSGRAEKEGLYYMNEEELNNYTDNR